MFHPSEVQNGSVDEAEATQRECRSIAVTSRCPFLLAYPKKTHNVQPLDLTTVVLYWIDDKKDTVLYSVRVGRCRSPIVL
jgi:hypothetical protein